MRMKQRFAKHVKINVARKWSDFVSNKLKFIKRHEMLAAIAAVAKTAVEVTAVTDF